MTYDMGIEKIILYAYHIHRRVETNATVDTVFSSRILNMKGFKRF